MEEPRSTPANEKSCQTDDITGEAVVPGPDHASKTLVYSTEPGDPALLQTQMLTSKSGIHQIIECFRTGTAQLKHILLKEVDTIFECKLCRSLFRGLPNLIKHKEIYCFTPDDPSGDDKKSTKDLIEAIYSCSDKEEYVLKFEPIASNQNAVYQYLSREDDLPPSSQSPNHTTTESWRHDLSDSDDEAEKNRIDEGDNMDKGKEDTEENMEHQDDSCRCLLCNKTYRVRGHLKRHLQTVHKIISSGSSTSSTDPTSESKKMVNGKAPDSPGSSCNSQSPKEDKVKSKAGISAGFDFKSRFCKLCKRSFSSVQNLEKHIELHTDNGTDFFVKFYSCPLCRYKTRRKRDVLRHLSDFHKKKSSYICRISSSLESYAVKKPAEVVLSKEDAKDQGREEVKVQHNHASPYTTRRNLKAPGVMRKTLKTGKGANGKKGKAASPKGSVNKKSLHVCNTCGQSFKKARYLGLHKRSHLKTTGIRTRSKVML
ncbi:zinc finger protein 800b [Pimephales promelas]|uniref:zinc finger protein 800b n=1 Tax=Pimephales promelas TaxID=90988 RepID=UPI0019556109|nr:zinc finger protein 800b [Pimephales promelas]XP_039516642.1 zinc finger protein 800b [Pimephales promelas]KAG1932496.1 hypothetical protein F2P79_021042 [Pimephales promelas]